MCWPLLRLCRPFCIFERCLDSNPESCRSKQVRYQLSHPTDSYVHYFTHCYQFYVIKAALQDVLTYIKYIIKDIVRFPLSYPLHIRPREIIHIEDNLESMQHKRICYLSATGANDRQNYRPFLYAVPGV